MEPRKPKRIYFLSDLHLGAAYIPDPRVHEQRIVSFLESIAGDAAELYLLGDILDYWFEYRTVVPRGYVRFFGALARLADSGVKITWFIGNHDIWLFDYLRDEIGLRIVDGYLVEEILGSRFFLSHGDGIGHLPGSFRFIRALFRNPLCQKLYSGIHPRWTIPFAHAWSRHSRKADEAANDTFDPATDNLATFAREYLASTDPSVNYFIFGHRHILVNEPLLPAPHSPRLIILGDWLTHFSYATFDGTTLLLHQYHIPR